MNLKCHKSEIIIPMVTTMNLKWCESEIIKPIIRKCPSTDMLNTNMSNLHTMTSNTNQYSVPRTAISSLWLTSVGIHLTLKV